MLTEAVRLHQTGDLDGAAALYRNVLTAEPGNADALHLLGFVSYQKGSADIAVEMIRKAIAVQGRQAAFHFHLGLALKALGRFDEAAVSYRRALALKPDDPDTLNNLGNALSAAQKFEEAVVSYRRLLSLRPGHDQALVNLGNALSELGQAEDAEACYRRAISQAPRNADAWNNLGDLLRGRGDLDGALAAFRKAVALMPENATAHNNLGITLWELGAAEEAQESYRRALQHDPGHTAALDNLAIALWRLGRLDEAEAQWRLALSLAPEQAGLLNNFAALVMARGQSREAMALVHRSLASRETLAAKRLFVELASRADFDGGGGNHALLARALSEAWERPARLSKAAARVLKHDPHLGPLLERANRAWPERLSLNQLLGQAGFQPLAENPLLLAMLTAAPNTDMELERFLTLVRGAALTAEDAGIPEAEIFRAALAQQSFINEYVFLGTEAETEAADALRTKLANALAADASLSSQDLLAAAAFFPLHNLPRAERLLARDWPEPARAVIRQQVEEPLKEARLMRDIPRLTPIEDAVSRLVRDQYEEHPYPRWVKIRPEPRESLPVWLARKFPLAPFRRGQLPASADILVAGCGTGQHSAATASRFGDNGMLAVDLSLASLAYAQRKSDEAGLSIAYGQADILELHQLGRDFDLIESVGVLHHMADPFAGWAALLCLLRPGGFLWLGFYSARARERITALRAEIAQSGIGVTADNIRRFRHELAGRADIPAAILESEDFFSISACRDLLFHTQEQTLTLGAIAAYLKDNGLVFLGFDLPDAVLDAYRARFPDDAAAVSLTHWEEFESENPGLFAAMYVFWAQKAA